MSDVTQILRRIELGDAEAAGQRLPLVYDELRKLAVQKMAQESPGQTLQATALVHEAYLRLVDVDQPQQWVGRGHFFAAAAESMRRIENFHLRVEARINRGGASGIFFRSPFIMRPGRVPNALRPAGGYEVELHRSPGHQIPTGSLWNAESSGTPKLLSKAADGSLTKDDEWFVLEVIAQGDHFITKVNGTQTAEGYDQGNKFQTGHIALQALNPQTIVQFRKIEIKELSSRLPPSAIAPFDASRPTTSAPGLKPVVK